MPTRRGSIGAALQVTNGEVTLDRLKDRRLKILEPRLTRAELKVWECRYFFRVLRASLHDEAATLYHVDALLGALRSVTLALQKDCRGAPGFEEWYAEKQKELQEHPELRILVELRNESQHEGFVHPLVHYVIRVRHYKNGKTGFLTEARFHHRFSADLLNSLRAAIAGFEKLVEEARQRGFVKSGVTTMEFPVSIIHEVEDTGAWRPPEKSEGKVEAIFELAEEEEARHFLAWGDSL